MTRSRLPAVWSFPFLSLPDGLSATIPSYGGRRRPVCDRIPRMLDMKFIRENPEAVKKGAQLKGMRVDVDRLLELDARKRSVQQRLQELQTEQNKASKELGPLMGQLKKEQDAAKKAELERTIESLKARPSAIKHEMITLEEQIKALDPDIEMLQLTIPLPPDDDVPVGKSSEDNVEILKWGEPRKFEFEPKSHIELGKSLGLFDVDRGVRMAGSRSYVLTGPGALLHQAVLRMAQDFMIHE